MTPDETFKEIEGLTADLISTGLCIDQNFPRLSRDGRAADVTFGKMPDLSITLKNIPYSEAYSTLTLNRAYNLKMIDGGLVQILYRFWDDELVKHRLAFFPSPDLLEYQNNSDVYEDDEIYGDIIDKNVVTVPVRFDFDPQSGVDYDHPVSHLTLGQYKNCRIPVTGGVSPFFFLNFILRAFYNTPFRKFCGEIKEGSNAFSSTITVREKKHMHVALNHGS